MGSCRILYVLFLFAFVWAGAEAQQNRYMVFFKNKEGISQSLSRPIEFLSEKAIQRRLKQNIEITADDLPVSNAYVQGVSDIGVDVFFRTRWMNGVLVQCDPSLLPSIEALAYVDRVELVAPLGTLQNGGRRSFNLRRKSNHTGSETETQLQMLGLDQMHDGNYKGQGVTIAILDSGFPGVNSAPAFQNIFSEQRFAPDVSYDFVHNSPDVFQYDDHGTEVLSVIGAEVPDAFTGGAYEASFQLFVTEDVPTEYRIEEYNWLFAAERADSAGVDIIHSSLGYYDFDDPAMNYTKAQMDGRTAIVTRAAQSAADRGIVVITSAGNEGTIASWRIITAPADAVDVLAVGGVNAALQKVPSSSIGPSADNRIKPDLAALGSGVKVVRATGQISTASGTSLAAPLVTSLAAGVLQRYPELGNKEVISLLRQTASQAKNPDNLLGFGIPNFRAIVNYQEGVAQTRPFEIYPNPLKDDTLTISPYDPDVIDSCEVEIISSQGQIIGRGTVYFDWLNRTYQADMSAMAPGVYFIRIHSEKTRHTFKLVKL
jgi:serine protease AprX